MTVIGRALAMLGFVACAAACGGGGGDNGGTSNPPPPVNRVPVAVVSGPTDTKVGASVTFDGRGSSDADGDPLSYRWTLFAPSGSNAALGDASADRTTLVPDVAGPYRIQLVVNDGRLDSAPAEHTLTATAPSPIQATLLTPRSGGLVADSFQVVVTLVSTYEVQGVRATLAGTQTDLAFTQDAWCPRTDDCGPGFVATLSLAAHPPGPFTLTIRATDVRGNSDERSIEIVHDNPPVLTATAPVDQSAALPTIPVDASCQDDLPGCVIELLVNDQLQKTEPSSLSGVFDLTPWIRQRVTMTLRARDSAGQRVIRNVSVFVEDSTRLAVLAEVPGPILDTDGRRLLFVEHLASGDRLAIHDNLTGLSETITMPEGRSVRPTSAFLTPTGAIFVTQAVDGSVLSSRLYLWRDGTFTNLAYPDSAGSLAVAGNYAIWNEGTDLYRIDTTTASQLLVTSDAGNTDNAVTADGTVVFWNRSYQIVRDRLGQQTVLADGADQWHVYPVAGRRPGGLSPAGPVLLEPGVRTGADRR
jgi:hypothetical protein